jgi:hypothetical protein
MNRKDDHILVPLPPTEAAGMKPSRVKYFIVQDIGVTSSPPASGTLLEQVEDPSTPAWLRQVFGAPVAER